MSINKYTKQDKSTISNPKPCNSIDKQTKLPCEKGLGHDGYHTREIVWSK